MWGLGPLPRNQTSTLCIGGEVTQSCLTLCDPMDCSIPGSSLPGILQARVLEWVAISFSRGSSWPRDQTWVSSIPGRCFNLWATREAPNSSGGNEGNGDLLQKIPCIYCYTQWPQPCSRLPPTHASIGYSWTLTGKSGSGCCGVTDPFSLVMVCRSFCLCPPRVCFPHPV